VFDAETHPYGVAPGTGAGGDGTNGDVGENWLASLDGGLIFLDPQEKKNRLRMSRIAYRLYRLSSSKWPTTEDRRTIALLIDALKAAKPLNNYGIGADELREMARSAPTHDDLNDERQMSAVRAWANHYWTAFVRATRGKGRTSPYEFVAVAVGVGGGSGTTVPFVNVFAAFPAFGAKTEWQSAPAVQLTTLWNSKSSSQQYPFRLGASWAIGNPDSALVSAQVAAYGNMGTFGFSQNTGDASVSGSLLLRSSWDGFCEREGSRDSIGPRSLYDHVRGGDLWLDAGVRYLDWFYRGYVFETSLTYGFPVWNGTKDYPELAPTVSLMKQYASSSTLQLTEYAAELRVPFARVLKRDPLYFTVRRGSQGDWAASFQIKF
jgi:hypothetical protein